MSRLTLLLAVMLLFVSEARTQPLQQPGSGDKTPPPLQPVSFPAAEVSKNNEIIITMGSAVSLPKSKDVTEIIPLRTEIAEIRDDPPASSQLVIIGKAVGTTTLTLRNKDKTEQTYTIIVEAPRLQVAKRLRSGFIAYSVDLPKENTVGAILGLNDYVVVFFTKSTDEEKRSIVLMKNIRVVAAPTGTVILEVTTEEAKILKTSQESGTLALGLIADADLKDEKALQDRKGERGSKK